MTCSRTQSGGGGSVLGVPLRQSHPSIRARNHWSVPDPRGVSSEGSVEQGQLEAGTAWQVSS